MTRIFFDFDGVLVRSKLPDKTFLWQKDIERDLKISASLKGLFFQQPEWNNILSGKADFRKRIEEVFRQNDLATSVDEFIHYWLSHDLNWHQEVLNLAASLRRAGHSLYLATNQDKIRSNHIRKQAEVIRLFDQVFSSSDLSITKPSPEFYLRIKEQSFPAAGETLLVIDDDIRNVEAARTVGWRGRHFNPDLDKTHSPQYLADAISSAL